MDAEVKEIELSKQIIESIANIKRSVDQQVMQIMQIVLLQSGAEGQWDISEDGTKLVKKNNA